MKTVMTFGTFDLAHPGHIYYLTEAKKHGDKLITVIARDKTLTKKIQHNENFRLAQIQKLDIADLVILGSETNKLSVITQYNPDIICLGYDQKVDVDKLKQITSAQIITIDSFKPHVFKSKLLKKHFHENN
tara:strand:- start:69 stop:461 length:393 start_codon:yes stop_codon:yes gene_type:complete